MVRLHVLTAIDRPQLWIWRDRTRKASAELAYDAEYVGLDADGLHVFDAPLDPQVHEHVHAQLHTEGWLTKERDEHEKTLPRTAQYRFPSDLWLAEGATRVLRESPFATDRKGVRIHLITATKYRGGRLFVWTPGGPSRLVDASGSDDLGPYYDVDLDGRDQHLFLFKAVAADGRYEPDYANRVWSATDGEEIWVHSQSTSISMRRPEKKPLVVHVLEPGAPATAQLHLWQEDSDFVTDVPGTPEPDGWVRFEHPVYAHRTYRFMILNPSLSPRWEHEEAKRNVILGDGDEILTISGDDSVRRVGRSAVWTIEGDHQLFGSRPAMDKRVDVEVAGRAPDCGIEAARTLDVWINHARSALHVALRPERDGRWSFLTYPEVVTSFKLASSSGSEHLERHFVKVPATAGGATTLFVVLGRADPVCTRPPPDLFADPPFPIERPGAWVADGNVRFAVHCPTASTVDVIGEWTGWLQSPLPMRSTRDGAYWWAQVPVSEVEQETRRESIHGVLYKFLLNGIQLVQDPAADWVESSDPLRASRLVDHGQYAWRSTSWRRPGWEYLAVYQLHPSRFARRGGAAGLDAIARELTAPDGYLRKLKATAILLMPTCEFAGDVGWGYNPSFFYSVESSYGGPDGLKRLVDASHENGFAVLMDVVFNHAGTSDNVLWSVARGSFFDGDTDWGAMINYDHPQVIHFFERNLAHFMDQYRIDGFRFDFTRAIYKEHDAHVKQPGSGGGWELLQKLRAAVHTRDSACLLMAENLPNDWYLTRPGAPMDTQWCDDFHDVLLEACMGLDVMGRLADAMKITHTQCCEWHEATNYPESHDEVGNEPHRISHVGRPGQGLRRNKLAAAATLLSRGIPLWFMGAEAGEWRQFTQDGRDALDLGCYETDDNALRVRAWWNKLLELRRGNPRIQGPAPLRIHYAQDRMLAFSRGDAADLFVVLNFGGWSGWRSLSELNLPDAEYKELLSSTWDDFRLPSEGEDQHANGGWDARLGRRQWLNIPDYGVVVLERR